MDRVYFRPCNGEVGLTPATRAIVEAAKVSQARGDHYDMVYISKQNADDRLKEWRKDNG